MYWFIPEVSNNGEESGEEEYDLRPLEHEKQISEINDEQQISEVNDFENESKQICQFLYLHPDQLQWMH